MRGSEGFAIGNKYPTPYFLDMIRFPSKIFLLFISFDLTVSVCCRRLTIRSERFIKGACSHFIHLRLPNRILHGMFRFIRVVVSDPSFYVSLPDRRSTMIYKANLPFSILPSFDVGRLCCFIYYFFSSYPSSIWFFFSFDLPTG